MTGEEKLERLERELERLARWDDLGTEADAHWEKTGKYAHLITEKALTKFLEETRSRYREAVCETALHMAEEKRLKKLSVHHAEKASDWRQKAMIAMKANREDLASASLARKSEHDDLAEDFERQWRDQKDTADRQGDAARRLSLSRTRALQRKNLLIARQWRAAAEKRLRDTVGGLGDNSDVSTPEVEEMMKYMQEAGMARAGVSSKEGLLEKVEGLLEKVKSKVLRGWHRFAAAPEDPEKILNQLIKDMRTAFWEAQHDVRVSLADERRWKKRYEAQLKIAETWSSKAEFARKANREDLYEACIARKSQDEALAEPLKEQWMAQKAASERLKEALSRLNDKIQEVSCKRDLLIARQGGADGDNEV